MASLAEGYVILAGSINIALLAEGGWTLMLTL